MLFNRVPKITHLTYSIMPIKTSSLIAHCFAIQRIDTHKRFSLILYLIEQM